jgi:hypothetical protein
VIALKAASLAVPVLPLPVAIKGERRGPAVKRHTV